MARSQGPQSQKGSETSKTNSLMHYMVEKNKLAVTSQIDMKMKREKSMQRSGEADRFITPVDIELFISKLIALDFLVPYDQFEIQNQVDESQIIGKWFNGLYVTLNARNVRSQFHLKKLMNEVRILKNIRHPNLEMTLGVTFEKQVKIKPGNKRTTSYRFYIVSENSEYKAKQDNLHKHNGG